MNLHRKRYSNPMGINKSNQCLNLSIPYFLLLIDPSIIINSFILCDQSLKTHVLIIFLKENPFCYQFFQN